MFHFCMKPTSYGTQKCSELHGFADACESSYGSVSYNRQLNIQNVVHVTFVLAKVQSPSFKSFLKALHSLQSCSTVGEDGQNAEKRTPWLKTFSLLDKAKEHSSTLEMTTLGLKPMLSIENTDLAQWRCARQSCRRCLERNECDQVHVAKEMDACLWVPVEVKEKLACGKSNELPVRVRKTSGTIPTYAPQHVTSTASTDYFILLKLEEAT